MSSGLRLIFLIVVSSLYSLFVQAESIFTQYQVPPLERIPATEPAKTILDAAKVIKRAQAVSILFTRVEDPDNYQQNLRAEILTALPTWIDEVSTTEFSGNKVSDLNRMLQGLTGKQRVSLQGQTLQVDEPLLLPAEVLLEGHNATLVATTVSPSVLIAPQTHHLSITDLTIQTSGLAVQIADAYSVILRNLRVLNGGRGVAILSGSRFVELSRLDISKPSQGGILIQGDVSQVWLHDSNISAGQRADNGGAGLLVTDALPQVSLEKATLTPSLTEVIWPLNPAPHGLLIENNIFSKNRAQGLYIEGGYGVVIQHNRIDSNDKEGICLDFGAVNNILLENTFFNNGQRADQSDNDLRHDLVLGWGRLADGSSVSKLPAISLDNAAQNIILRNIVRDSGGDGLKMVRTGLRNFVLFNVFTDNNRGHNSRLHFFGVLLGTAPLEPELAQTPIATHTLDFLPAIENIVAGNIIEGTHWSGILLDHDASFNDIYDNMVRHYRHLPLEQATNRYNSMVGNSWQTTTNSLPQPWLGKLSVFKILSILLFCIVIVLIALKYKVKNTNQ